MDFSAELINWYNTNKRDLPWRNTNDPYSIWLSEIILQQTRVDQGLSYYNKFITTYPSVKELGNANVDEVLKLWQGLGYYSRARNLHATAKYITKEFNSQFPKKYEEILKLKGIGEYTAAAISSFAFNLNYPVIDGNVYRVLSRVFGVKKAIDSTLGKKEFKQIAQELIDKNNPAIYNQAIMEFGALQCTPKNPVCENCPFIMECVAYQTKTIDKLPFKEKKTKQRNRYFNYLVIEHDNHIYLTKREKKDIWQGLFEFPLIETDIKINSYENLPVADNFSFLNNDRKKLVSVSDEYKHILSHQKLFTTFWKIKIDNEPNLNTNYKKIPLNEINKYAVPKLIENYLKTIL